jgi:two-component system response regulator
MIDANSIEILLVEDNLRDAELMIRALKKRNLANHLFHVSDGVEAVDFLLHQGNFEDRKNTESPKVIFLDLKLPRMNGLEVLREIKSNEITKTIPVVVTSSNEDPDIKRAYDLEASSYVVKPVDFDSFSEVMSNIGFYWLLINTTLEKPIQS